MVKQQKNADRQPRTLTLGDLAGLVRSLPALGEESERFKKDLNDARKRQPRMPKKDKWA